MVQATGFAASYPGTTGQPAVAGLDAQLTRLQKELSECVNCASANTIEGKRKIQEVADRISSVKIRLDKITTQPRQSENAKKIANTPQTQQSDTTQTSPLNGANTSRTLGSIINITA